MHIHNTFLLKVKYDKNYNLVTEIHTFNVDCKIKCTTKEINKLFKFVYTAKTHRADVYYKDFSPLGFH